MSKVTIKPAATTFYPQLAEGSPEKARGIKCERCWRYTSDVADDRDYPTVCLRCAEALHALNFPPYDKPAESAA